MSTHRPIKVEKNSVLIGNRSRLNLLEGLNVTLTATDDSANDEIDVTITASGAAGRITATYIVYVVGGTYYALNGATGAITSNAALHTLLGTLSGTVYMAAGAYTLSDQVLLTSGFRLIGEGKSKTIITCTMATTDVGIFYTSNSTPFAAHVHLAANCVKGDTSATLTSTASFSAEDWVKIGSAAYFDDGYAAGGAIGEIIQIASIASPVLTFDRAVIDTYNTADTAIVSKITFIKNVGFEGITFIGPGNDVDNTLIWAYALKGVYIKDCAFEEFGVDCLRFIDSLDVTIDECEFASVYMASEGYAVAFLMASDNCNVINSVFREYGRHSVVLSTGGSYAQAELDCGGPRNVHLTGCHFESITGGTGEAINTHHGVYGPLVVSNCTFLYCDNVAQIVNCETVFTGNTFRNCPSNGLHFRNNIGTITVRPIVISGNVFYDTDLRASQSHMTITGNSFYGNSMILVEAGTSGANPDVYDINIVGNTWRDCTAAAAIYIYGTDANHMQLINVAGNYFYNGTTYDVYAAWVKYLKVEGNFSYSSTGYFFYGRGDAASKYCDYVSIKNNWIDTPANYAIAFIGGTNLEIVGNRITNSTSRGISLASAKTAATPVIIRGNWLETSGARLYNDGTYTNISTDSVICPFVKELGTGAWVSATHMGIDVDAANEGGLAFGHIPLASQLYQIKVWGIEQTDPGAGNGMMITLLAHGSKEDEAYNAETVSASKVSNTDDLSAGDRIVWIFGSGNDTDIDEIQDNEAVQISVTYSAASGSDIATDVCLQYVELCYV